MPDSKLVLVIDDEVESLEILSLHLEADGYRVITATSGTEGMRVTGNAGLPAKTSIPRSLSRSALSSAALPSPALSRRRPRSPRP